MCRGGIESSTIPKKDGKKEIESTWFNSLMVRWEGQGRAGSLNDSTRLASRRKSLSRVSGVLWVLGRDLSSVCVLPCSIQLSLNVLIVFLITPSCNGSATFLYLFFRSLAGNTISRKYDQRLPGYSEPLKKTQRNARAFPLLCYM